MSDEEQRRVSHLQDEAGSRLAAAPAAPWPETADISLGQDEGPTGHLWAFDGVTDAPVADVTGELVSLGFIRAALRRSRWLWCTAAVVGLLIGLVAFKAFPPSYQASTSILLPNNQQINAVLDDQAIAQSRTVAGAALRRLGLREDPGVFVGDYTVAVLTNRVLAITVKAMSYQTAIREANALAAAFLAFQKNQALTLEELNNSSLQQSINEATKNVASIAARIRSLSSQPASPAKHAELASLLSQRGKASADLLVLEKNGSANKASLKINTAALINGGHVLDLAVPLPQHAKKYLLLYVGGGLVAGLALSLSIVVIRALVSDRLRRRDDVARALDAPVKLSVGKVRLSRWRPGRRGLEAAQGTDLRRIVAYLEREVPSSSSGPVSLALVPADDVQVPAVCLVSLAISRAQKGSQVVVADLCSGSPAARLLRATGPGVHPVSVHDAHLLVAVPEPDDMAPMGPLRLQSREAQAADPVAAACASADLLLTLAPLDPSLGGDHLAGWTHDAVVVVTAGRSSAARVHVVGEMIRLSGTKLLSAVLVGADKTDESLGVTGSPSPPTPVSRGLGS